MNSFIQTMPIPSEFFLLSQYARCYITRRRFIIMNRTVERAMQIMQIVSQTNKGSTLQEISEEMGIPKSSAFVIVQTLLHDGYLATTRYNDKKYKLGLKLFTLGMRYVDDLSLVDQCIQFLDPLADKYRKTAFVGIMEGDSVVYVHKYVSKDAVLASCALGSRKPVYATALGKAILANTKADVLDKILQRISLDPVTENTITDIQKLKEDLAATEKRGYSIDIKEHLNNTVCCGAPVFDYSGLVVAAISLSDVHDGPTETMGKDLRKAADKISASLGYIDKN